VLPFYVINEKEIDTQYKKWNGKLEERFVQNISLSKISGKNNKNP